MRLFITTLSMLSVFAFGYALAGYGTSFFGNAIRMDYIIWGLSLGFLTAGLALFLWYRHRHEFFDYESDEPQIDNTVSLYDRELFKKDSSNDNDSK